MFGKILKRTFWSWWDNISYSILTSVLGGTNPFFLWFLATFHYTVANFDLVVDNPDEFTVFFSIMLLTLHVFPTTLASYAMQSQLIDGKMNRFFRSWWEALKKYFVRGIVVTLINGAAGYMLGNSVVYYKNALESIYPFNYVLIGFSGLFFFILLISQIIMIPLMVTDKYKIYEYYLIAIHMTFKKGFVILLVGLINVIIFLIFMIPVVSPFLVVVPLIAYFGFAGTLHHWTFRYADGQVDKNADTPKRKIGEIFSPFGNLFKSRKQIDEQGIDEENKDEGDTNE